MIVEDVIPTSPAQVHIEITNKCNLACGFCPVHRAERGEALTSEEIFDLIDQSAAFDVDYIDFINYNEPLTCKEFWAYADHVTARLGPGHMGMVTNGTVMTREIADRLLNLHAKQVVFSIDAFTAETYAKVRPRWTPHGPVEDLGLRDQIYENVNLYLERVPQVTGAWPVIEMVVCDLNAHEVVATRDYWLPRLHNQFLVINCTGRGGERAFTTPNENPCRVILDGLWVLSDGRVVACCEDWNGVSTVGDIREEGLEQIWNGERIKAFRAAHLERRKRDVEICRGCLTSLDSTDYYKFPERTDPNVLHELRLRGVV